MNLESIRNQTNKMILTYSVPAIIAMLLTSLVTIVDGLFITNLVGKEALSGIHLGLPILYVFLGISIMIGVGGVTIAGKELGKGNANKSVNVFNQTFWTTALSVTLLSTLSLLLLNPVLEGFKVQQVLQTYMKDYYGIILWVYPFMMMNVVSGMFIRAEGQPHIFMLVTLIINVLNVVLDYVFILKLEMGVGGAASASGISILLGFILMNGYFVKFSKVFKFSRFKFSKPVAKMTVLNGSSELIGQLSFSITNFLFNAVVLKEIGVIGLAATSLVGYSGYMFNMIVIGFGQGTGPMISYCTGAKELGLSMQIRKHTLRIVTGVAIVFWLLLTLLSKPYANAFTDDLQLIALIVMGLRIYAIAFGLISYNVLNSFYFTSMGYPKESAIISSSRGLIVLSIAIMILPKVLGILGVWLVAPVTELITAFIVYYFIRKLRSSREYAIESIN